MFAYLIKATVCWTVFYLLYQVLWKQERSFVANRAYLLSTLLMGLVVPLLHWEVIEPKGILIAWETVPDWAAIAAPTETLASAWRWSQGWIVLYATGVCVAGGLFLKQLVQLYYWYQLGEKTYFQDHTIVELPQAIPPFSFGRCLFVGVQYQEEAAQWASIRQHELAHIRQYHSLDVLLLASLRVVFWFHPLLWLYDRALRDQHEYAADAAALQVSSVAQYGRLLLDQSLQFNPNALTHLFFHSPLKKRIMMMTHRTRGSRPFLKYSLSLLATALLTWQITAQQTPAEGDPDTKPYIAACASEDVEAQTQCSNTKLITFLSETLKYPKAVKDQQKEGMVVVSFEVLADGSMSNARLLKEVHPALDEEALRVVRLAQSTFKWAPATKDGKAVKAVMSIPIKFKLK